MLFGCTFLRVLCVVCRDSFLSILKMYDAPLNTLLHPPTPRSLLLFSLCCLLLLNLDPQIKKAEALLKTYTRDPTCVPPLLQQMRSSQHEQARQLAAMLLKRRILAHWKKFNDQEKVKKITLKTGRDRFCFVLFRLLFCLFVYLFVAACLLACCLFDLFVFVRSCLSFVVVTTVMLW